MKREGEPIACLVPFCCGKSWKWRNATEYLCAKHTRLTDPAWRIYRNRIIRAADKAEREGFDASLARQKANEIWDKRLRPQALERAMAAPEEREIIVYGTIPRAPRVRPDF